MTYESNNDNEQSSQPTAYYGKMPLTDMEAAADTSYRCSQKPHAAALR